ncbi:hypothetical protein SNE32_15755, partial [Lysobacter sp. D1-1-M9]|uniref:hypothetical protein n=1 Tax=Novilysobacter longmucuonensis TaxID=3098603 RepID=UPI002FC9D6C9
PIWFFAPLVIASQLGRPREHIYTDQIGGAFRMVLLGLAVGFLMFSLTRWAVDRLYTPANGRVMTAFAIDGSGVEPLRGRFPQQLDKAVGNGRTLGIGELGISLGAASFTSGPSSITASTRICAGEKRTSLRFGYVMPYVNPKARGIFELSASFNGKTRWTRALPDGGELNDVKIEDFVNPGECGVLTYT